MVLSTNSLFVTFFRGDLLKTPEELVAEASGIKPLNYGWHAAGADEGSYRNPAYTYRLKGWERTEPPPTVVIAPYKEDCKRLRKILMGRADYRALTYTSPTCDVQQFGDDAPGGQTTCQMAKILYQAANAYAFKYEFVPPAPVHIALHAWLPCRSEFVAVRALAVRARACPCGCHMHLVLSNCCLGQAVWCGRPAATSATR